MAILQQTFEVCFFKTLCFMPRYGLLFVSLFALQAAAQPGSLAGDLPYFRSQLPVYQAWLDEQGLGRYLKAYAVEVYEETLYFSLAYQTTAPYQAVSAARAVNTWDQLKEGYDTGSPLPLEQALFYRMAELLQVEPARAVLQLYDTYDPIGNSAFHILIGFRDGQVVYQPSYPKSETVYIPVGVGDFSNRAGWQAEDIRRKLNRAVLLDWSEDFLRAYLSRASCEEGSVRIYPRAKRDLLWLEGEGACRLVVGAEQNALCAIIERLGLGGCPVREKFSFKVFWEEREDGMRLHCEIDGHYSEKSAIWGRGDYKPLEGSEFDGLFRRFADVLATEMREALLSDIEAGRFD